MLKGTFKTLATASVTLVSNFFKWDTTRSQNTEDRHEQKIIGYTDKMIDLLVEIRPLLQAVKTNKVAKNDLQDIYTYIRKIKQHRAKC